MTHAQILAVGGYLSVIALLGYRGYARTDDEVDFLVAGRDVGRVVGAGTLLASQISASTVVGAVGIHYTFGIGFIWVWLGILVGWLAALGFVAPQLRRFGGMTVPDFLGTRYADDGADGDYTRAISALLIVGVFTVFLTAQYTAGALILGELFGLPEPIGIGLTAVIAITYTAVGGMRTSVLTDFLQAIVLVGGLVIAVPLALDAVGGVGELTTKLRAIDPSLLGQALPLPRIGGFVLASGFGIATAPVTISRFYAMRDEGTVRSAIRLSLLAQAVIAVAVAVLGLSARVLFPELETADLAAIVLSQEVLGPTVGMLFLLAVLSAILSTIDSVLLAASAEVALDRLELERRLRTRQPIEPGPDGRPDGERRTQELIGEVVAADSRSEIQKLVCTGLERADAYSGAWTAAVDATGERLCLTERAGVDEDRLAPIDDASLSAVGDGAVETAIETGEVAVLDRSALFERAGRQHERTGAAAAVALAPLAHGDKVFGILAVHAPDPDAFGPADRQRLAVLGDTISFVLSALENERLLLSDEFVQLEFQVTDPDCLSVALSDELDTAVSMKRTVQNADDEHLSYVRIEDASPEAARAAARSIDSVHDCRVVTDYDYGCLLEVTRSSSGAEVMMEFGATMRTAEAESGRGRLVLEAPHSVDVRRIVQAYQSYNPESELLSKRRVDRPVRAADQLRADVEDDLTEKQLSAVSAAYFSGYYEWPRESTAEEVADSMEISASTLHQHLRHAHQKLLSSILETSFSRRL